jgi:hypothetical protein
MRNTFSNRRQWQDFVASVHASVTLPYTVTYPIVLSAVRSGRAWFALGAARASTWLGAEAPVADTVSLARSETQSA